MSRLDYSKWDDLSEPSDDEDSGAVICVPGKAGGPSTIYSQEELRTERPWREQAPPPDPRFTGGEGFVYTGRRRPAAAAPAAADVAAPAADDGDATAAPETAEPSGPEAEAAAAEAAEAAAAAEAAEAAEAERAASAPLPLSFDYRKVRAVQTLNDICGQERIAMPHFTYTQQIDESHRAVFTCEAEWRVQGQLVVVTSAAQGSKKGAKASAAMELIDECARRGLLEILPR